MAAISQKYENGTSDRIIRPQREGYEAERMQILDDDGLAAPGEIIRPHDIYINKESPTITRGPVTSPMGLPDSAYKPSRQTYKGPEGETAVVDRVSLCSDKNNNLCIKFMIRHTRRPEVGDKFSSRHGQKGVCGTIVQQEDLPFSERGICPDLIMNPHGFPSRMTVGKMIELLGSKAGVSSGRFHYGSAFGEPSGHADRVEAISETLVKHGFSYNGKDFIYSGITGEPLQAYIFMGPIYYQKLKHMVLDKMHARGSGPRVMITRQPTEGRSRNGGLRVGEMERDCLIAYGASMLIYERLMISSDPFEVQVCRKCGLLGYYNFKLKTANCSTCKNGDNISTMKLPYACKLLFQGNDKDLYLIVPEPFLFLSTRTLGTSSDEYCSPFEVNRGLNVYLTKISKKCQATKNSFRSYYGSSHPSKALPHSGVFMLNKCHHDGAKERVP
ncbi:nuclear RNA polymerase C2 [Forsythia ovata]|uniref:DNA-directed RNA polymerase n=1 Tax=Forsythia ovata TaxID=205694 RepID=A0ABD1TPR1_9LAMI